MVKTKIYGAGSIGNHLAHACRCKGWDVVICDKDLRALERTKNDIYPSRYGEWDNEIKLVSCSEADYESFDLVIVGTPPDSHIPIAIDVLRKSPPKVLLLEKPLCEPSLQGLKSLQDMAVSTGTFVGVGYNHTLTQHTLRAEQALKEGVVKEIRTISARFREHWGGIFAAHPWLNGPQDSYLGYWERGGGASGEHSHAINIWQHFAHLLGVGRISEVNAVLDMVDDGEMRYDRICQIHVKTDQGLVGSIVQDVITDPAQKSLRIQGVEGFLEWLVNLDKDTDGLRYWDGRSEVLEERFPKTRPDDFKGEIDHLADILLNKAEQSPISLERGIETMLVVAAVHMSHAKLRTVRINYEADMGPEAFELI